PSEHRRHGRLLEHDFRDPDPVRIPGPAPGEPAALPAEPREEPFPDAVATPGRGRQETVTSARGAIQPGSFMRLRTKAFSSSFGRTSAACFAYASGDSFSPRTE